MIHENRNPTLKIILLGNTNGGKTSIIPRYVNEEFKISTMPTVATGFYEKEAVVGDFNPKVQLWDTAGQERFASLSRIFYRKADACLLIFDLARQDSFETLDHWKAEFLFAGAYSAEDTPPIILVGNKKDLKMDFQHVHRDIEKWAGDNKMLHFEVSACKNIGISDLFEAVCEKALSYNQEQLNKNNEKNIKLDKLAIGSEKQRRCCCITL